MGEGSQIESEGQSGGVNITDNAQVQGDVVGRDKTEVQGDLVGRDKIVIGEGAQNVAVNSRFIFQNNVRIGKLVIPARLIIALLAVALVVAAVVWYVVVPAQMPPYTFNVAVAEFGQLDSQGKMHNSQDGSKLSEWMYGKLKDETNNLPEGLKITLWHDSLGLTQKRVGIGIIADEAAAKEKAKEINAHVLIYGNLQANQDPATFIPTFYVSDVKGEADEIVGSQQLGSAIAVQLPLDFSDQRLGRYLDKNLRPRAQALLWFTGGLADDLIGDHPHAYQVFRQAEKQLTDWDEHEGKEVLHYFIGREALFMSQNEGELRQAFNSADEALDEAEQEFTRAKEINPKYARAYFGLGQVGYQRAQRLLAARPVPDANLQRARSILNEAVQLHEEALRLAPQSPGSQIEVKIKAALAASHYLLGNSYLIGADYADAESSFKQAVNEFETVLPLIDKNDYRDLAQTYYALGEALYNQGHTRLVQQDKENSRTLFEAAIREFQQCSDQAKAFPYDSFLAELKDKYCEPRQAAVQDALAALQ